MKHDSALQWVAIRDTDNKKTRPRKKLQKSCKSNTTCLPCTLALEKAC